ncbi:MAG: type II toxin-antitoxin system RelE/ParE family toxin [Methylovirgula sp.]|uniref:type II toxin-antitoxin system RelE/ParE family toxin n=1 Tax=Methylovirgula sp. TaxID=1978224 RepID=UPI0030760556
MAQISVTATADSDTAEIISYLDAKAGRDVAARYVAAFEDVYDRLAIYPQSGAPRATLGSQVRISVVAPFVIIYEYIEADDLVIILRVLHGHRKISVRSLLRGT